MVVEKTNQSEFGDILCLPPTRVDAAELRGIWHCTTLRIIADKCHDFDFWPELAVRIRGAFGQALHRSSNGYSRRGMPLFSAYQALFDHQSWLAPRFEIAKPFTIRAWPQDDYCIVELRLFGVADQWLEPAADSLIEALESGIAVKAERSFRVPMRVREAYTTVSGYLEPIERASAVTLRFRSPVAVRRDARHIFHPSSIVGSMVKRAESLAPWQLSKLEHDRASLRAKIASLEIDDRDLVPYTWQRYSKNGGDQAIGVAGQIGDLRLTGNLAPLLDYFQIAACANTGSHAALGLGWFDLIVYP